MPEPSKNEYQIHDTDHFKNTESYLMNSIVISNPLQPSACVNHSPNLRKYFQFKVKQNVHTHGHTSLVGMHDTCCGVWKKGIQLGKHVTDFVAFNLIRHVQLLNARKENIFSLDIIAIHFNYDCRAWNRFLRWWNIQTLHTVLHLCW